MLSDVNPIELEATDLVLDQTSTSPTENFAFRPQDDSSLIGSFP